jgi:dolichyl-phosphate-mannose-protein mannosyltransferase
MLAGIQKDRWTWLGLSLVVALSAFGLFRYRLEYPATFHFDEFHYIPAARDILKGEKNRNWEHPPLAKYLMALSVSIWGDQPTGWRMGW